MESRSKQVAVDSREIEPEGLFFALPGARVDGHRFLEQVAKQGAQGAVVAKEYIGPDFGLALTRVPDVLEALQARAKERFAQLSGTVIAVTGSMGKTMTKEFARQLIPGAWATPGNQNSQIGLPLALLNLREDPPVVILEMGMTAPGQIRHLVELFPPDIALLTTVAWAHSEGFASLQEVAQAKAEIFSVSRTQLGITGFEGVRSSIRAETFSMTDPTATFYLDGGGRVFEAQQQVGTLHWHLPARHHQASFLAAAALARRVGESWEDILARGAHLKPIPGRFSVQTIRGITVVDDSYNSNERSVCAALESLPLPEGGRQTIAVLGEVWQRDAHVHKRVAKFALDHVQVLLCVGEKTRPMASLWQSAGRQAKWYASSQELFGDLKALVSPGDVVLFKGARPCRLEWVINQLKVP